MNILLVVSGSISCYKSFDLLRLYIKSGHSVKVVLTKGAQNFIRPQLFSFLGAKNIFFDNEDFDLNFSNSTPLHIELARWTNLFVVAPMSANLLSRLTCGNAGDLANSIFLALDQSIIKCFYPAMNTKMLENQFVKDNFKKLNTLKNTFVHPTEYGELACGEIGFGKLTTVEEIFFTSIYFKPCLSTQLTKPLHNNNNKKTNVLITTGATLALIDPVRYLTNPSSGKTGFYLALEALKRNFKVKVLAGKYATKNLDLLTELPNFSIERVVTTEQLFEKVKENFFECDYYFSPAAISDFSFNYNEKKIKKDDFVGQLNYRPTPDILEYLIKNKSPEQNLIGFAAESELSDKNLMAKYLTKPVDFLIGTKVNQETSVMEEVGFSTEGATYKIFKKDVCLFDGELKKVELANFIFNQLLINDEQAKGHS